MNNISKYGPLLLRVGLSLVFLWFSANQFMNPEMWTRVVPAWASGLFGSAATVVTLNAWFELVFGILLLIGFQTRIVATILGLHLIGISSGFGLSPTGVRDWGLCLATFSLALYGATIFSIDSKLARKVEQA